MTTTNKSGLQCDMSRRVFARFGEMARFRIKLTRNIMSANPDSLTFCIAHFNAPDFLDATLHAIRRFHPDARVIVADASSVWREYVAAKASAGGIAPSCIRWRANTGTRGC